MPSPSSAARRLRWPDLVWSHFSRPRFGEFDGRVAAAAAAGFKGIGLFVGEYERLRVDEQRSLAEIGSLLDRHAVALADAEVARGWWAAPGGRHHEQFLESRRIERSVFEMADAFGLRYLQVIGSYECGFEQAVDGFGSLCDRAAAHGVLVGLEWLPYTNIATAAEAQRIVNAAGRANGGYCVDIWHHVRGADDPALIARLEPERIFSVQISDGTRRPAAGATDYKADCLANRLPPGEGEFGCVQFVQMLTEMRVTAPISVEVCSHELWSAPVEYAARRGADAMRAVLAEAFATR